AAGLDLCHHLPQERIQRKGGDARACLRILALAVGGCRGPTLRAGSDLLPRDTGGGRAGGVPRILDLPHRRRSLGRSRLSRLRGLVPARRLLRAGPSQRDCRLRETQEPARQGRRGVRRGQRRGPLRIRERRACCSRVAPCDLADQATRHLLRGVLRSDRALDERTTDEPVATTVGARSHARVLRAGACRIGISCGPFSGRRGADAALAGRL
ncbi:MAG: hypothetical protein AVDCRST_MAG58-2770, partial [uncultured Rubrobacteraceae bacterium]